MPQAVANGACRSANGAKPVRAGATVRRPRRPRRRRRRPTHRPRRRMAPCGPQGPLGRDGVDGVLREPRAGRGDDPTGEVRRRPTTRRSPSSTDGVAFDLPPDVTARIESAGGAASSQARRGADRIADVRPRDPGDRRARRTRGGGDDADRGPVPGPAGPGARGRARRAGAPEPACPGAGEDGRGDGRTAGRPAIPGRRRRRPGRRGPARRGARPGARSQLDADRALLETDNAALAQQEQALWREIETLRQYAALAARLDQLMADHVEGLQAADPTQGPRPAGRRAVRDPATAPGPAAPAGGRDPGLLRPAPHRTGQPRGHLGAARGDDHDRDGPARARRSPPSRRRIDRRLAIRVRGAWRRASVRP